jgi:hypothetical protein
MYFCIASRNSKFKIQNYEQIYQETVFAVYFCIASRNSKFRTHLFFTRNNSFIKHTHSFGDLGNSFIALNNSIVKYS